MGKNLENPNYEHIYRAEKVCKHGILAMQSEWSLLVDVAELPVLNCYKIGRVYGLFTIYNKIKRPLIFLFLRKDVCSLLGELQPLYGCICPNGKTG